MRKLPNLLGPAILLGLMCATYAIVLRLCLAQTDGHFAYGLDDPYIHLAIAKNLAFHGVWGVTPYASTSASSSPLWTCFLAIVIRIFGNYDIWPLIFGIAASVASTLVVYFRFLKSGFNTWFAVVGAAAVFAIGPFHLLPFIGMEHCLQILLDLIFVFWLLDTMARKHEARDLLIATTFTTLICACRYEDAFLVVVPVLTCLWQRDWRLAGALTVGPVLAIGGFALYSHFSGMPSIPNSILIKGNTPKSSLGNYLHFLSLRTFYTLFARSPVSDLFLLNVFAGLALRTRGLRESTSSLQVCIWTVVVATMLHAGLASIGIFYRYEAYLVVLLFTCLLMALKAVLSYRGATEGVHVSSRNWVIAIGAVCIGQVLLSRMFWFYQWNFSLIICINAVAVIALFAKDRGPTTQGRLRRVLVGSYIPLALFLIGQARASFAMEEIPAASRDIYLQQVQMSRFLARYYPSGRLAANDIGAVTYFTHVHLLDLFGLASNNIMRLKLTHNFSTATLGREFDAFKPDLVIAYPRWYQGAESFPKSMIPVATWTIPAVTTAAFSSVIFYAPSPSEATKLRSELVEFQPSLPSRVGVEFLN